MSASERLRALEGAASGPQTYGPEPLEWEEAAASIMDALPQIVAVVKAAEMGRDRSVLIEEHVSTIEKVAWRVEDAQALQAALAALDEAL